MTILSNNEVIVSLMFNNVLDIGSEGISIKGFIIYAIADKLNLEKHVTKLKEIRNIVIRDIVTERDAVKVYVDMPKIFRITNITQLICTTEALKSEFGYRLNKIGFTNYELQFY